jgi:hypothetical protein
MSFFEKRWVEWFGASLILLTLITAAGCGPTPSPQPNPATPGNLSITARFSVSYACSIPSLPCQVQFPGSVAFTGTRATGPSGPGATCINNQQGGGCAYAADDATPMASSVNCGSSSNPRLCQDLSASTNLITGLAPGTWQVSATATSTSSPFQINSPNPLTCQAITITGGATASLALNYVATSGCR